MVNEPNPTTVPVVAARAVSLKKPRKVRTVEDGSRDGEEGWSEDEGGEEKKASRHRSQSCSAQVAAAESEALLLLGYHGAAATSTGSAAAARPLLSESPCMSTTPPTHEYLPRHDPYVSHFTTSPRDGSPEIGDYVLVFPVVPPIDLDATPVVVQSTGTQRKNPRVVSPPTCPMPTTCLMKCPPRRRPIRGLTRKSWKR